MNIAITRLNKEARDYERLKDEIKLSLRDEKNIYKWQAILKGPPDTPYSEGAFLVNIDVPTEYPIAAPKCKFITKVFHPNIHFETGEICFELLKDKWSPQWTLESVCRAILDLLRHPNADSPLNCDCGKY
jgi:peroxin-4